MSLHRVTITQILKGQRIQNVLHFRNPDGLVIPEQIANEVEAGWIGTVRNLQGTQLTYNQIVVQNLGNSSEAPYVKNLAIQGAATGFDPLMPFLAVVIQKRTAFAGRHGRGRYYIAGWTQEGLQSDGMWQTGHLTGVMQTMIDNLNGFWISFNESGLHLRVCPHDATVDTDGHDVTQMQVRPSPGLQRRRCIGVGI